MALNPFNWTPSTGVNDTTAFPASDKLFRVHLQALLDQVKNYFNNDVTTELNSKASTTQETIIAPTLLNSWVNYGAPFANVGYYKDTLGIVHLQGMAKSGAVGSIIFFLPTGYRPLNSQRFVVDASSAVGEVGIGPDGSVTVANGTVTAFVSLSGITFRAGV